MLTLIGVFLLIYWVIKTFGENAGAWVIGILVVVGIIAFCRSWDAESRAHWNRVNYWAYGKEPDWKQKKNRERNDRRY